MAIFTFIIQSFNHSIIHSFIHSFVHSFIRSFIGHPSSQSHHHKSFSRLILILTIIVIRAIQSGGFGRSAMYQIERLAALPPLNATVMALDTTTKKFQTTPESIAIFNKIRGSEVIEADFRSNEEWYTRQGYDIICYIDDMYKWVDQDTGITISVPSVFMKKHIV